MRAYVGGGRTGRDGGGGGLNKLGPKKLKKEKGFRNLLRIFTLSHTISILYYYCCCGQC